MHASTAIANHAGIQSSCGLDSLGGAILNDVPGSFYFGHELDFAFLLSLGFWAPRIQGLQSTSAQVGKVLSVLIDPRIVVKGFPFYLNGSSRVHKGSGSRFEPLESGVTTWSRKVGVYLNSDWLRHDDNVL